jgi:hypothetical protein
MPSPDNPHYEELTDGHLIAYLSVAIGNALNHLERCEPNDAEDWLRLAKKALGDG